MSVDYIPRKDFVFLAWVKNFLEKALTFIDSLGLHADDLEEMEKECDNFDAALKIAEEPSTRTSTAVINKNNARKKLEALIRAFIKRYITGNTDVTDGMRNDMGLPIYSKSRIPTKDPETWPVGTADCRKPRSVIIHYHDSEIEGPAKPKGVHGVEIKWGFGDKSPMLIEDLTNSVFDTRTPYQFDFRDEDRGRTVYFALRWENTLGRKGIWSEMINAIIA